MKEKINKLTISAFSEVTGYSTQQLSNYQKKENQEKFKFFTEDNQIFVLCTNAELRNYRKNMKSNTIEAEAEKTARSLEMLQNSLEGLAERFQDSIKREATKSEEMQFKTIQNINSAASKMQIDNTNISNINDSFLRLSADLGDVVQKIAQEHSQYKSYFKDLDTKYTNTQNIIASVLKTTEAIENSNKQLIQTANSYNRALSQNINTITETSNSMYSLLQSVKQMKSDIEYERRENYIKKYLFPIIIPSVIIIIVLIINIFSYKKIVDNQKIIYSKIENIQQPDTENDNPFSNKKKNYKK